MSLTLVFALFMAMVKDKWNQEGDEKGFQEGNEAQGEGEGGQQALVQGARNKVFYLI